MKNFYFLMPFMALLLACGKTPAPKQNTEWIDEAVRQSSQAASSAEQVRDADPGNVKDIVKNWRLDNPHVPEFMVDLDYGVTHKLHVRMYDSRPFADDYQDSPDMYRTFGSGHYALYSRWRGDVYALDINTGKYFLVWSDNMHYNTKVVEDLGNSNIRLVYKENYDIDDETDVIYYNLDTHNYRIEREHNNYPPSGGFD